MFYKKNWKVLVLGKLIIIGVITLMLCDVCIFSNNNKFSQNHNSSAYAGDLCGNGTCDVASDYCSVNTSYCSKVDTGSCESIEGCYIMPGGGGSCSGGIADCSTITDSTACLGAKCFRDAEMCSNINPESGKSEDTECYTFDRTTCSTIDMAGGNCFRASEDNCEGTITAPKNESACNTMNDITTNFGFNATWTAGYDENTSCPSDCNPVEDTCVGIPVENCASEATSKMMSEGKSCESYYSTSEEVQCLKDGLICKAGLVKCVVPDSICGNGIKETGEECDDRNIEDNDGCSTSCTIDGEYLPYTAEGEVTILIGNNVIYNEEENKFFIPEGVNLLMFLDGNIALGWGGDQIVFLMPYTATGEVSDISNEIVDWFSDGENNTFVMDYSGSLDYPITGFTFTDSGVNMEAEYSGESWNFSITAIPTCQGDEIATCSEIIPAMPEHCALLYYSAGNYQCTYDSKTAKCTEGNICSVATTDPVCGDGNLEGSEECDDGNIKDNDGCSSICETEEIPVCSGAETTKACSSMGDENECNSSYSSLENVQCSYNTKFSTCESSSACSVATPAICGNEQMEGDETCDDGNTKDNDGCSSTCQIEVIEAICGNEQIEGDETCDDGNTKDNDGCSSTCQIEAVVDEDCGDNIIDWTKEICDDGINNGNIGQCNASCDGRLPHNKYCGDGMCSNSCTISADITCKTLDTTPETKALCTTLGCFLQTTNNFSCDGTLACEKINKDTFGNNDYMVSKYCSIAGCSYDKQSGLCSTPAKAPSCGSVTVPEYCKVFSNMGCTLTSEGSTTSCVGNTALRSDKLNEDQCAVLSGTWIEETTASCSEDCKDICAPISEESCSALSVEECASYSNGTQNCMVNKGSCTEGGACKTCGNNICDGTETYSSCPSDCIPKNNWPSISYSPSLPKDGSLVSGPVVATINVGDGCSITNNNGKNSYTFKYNGYYIFEVKCPRFPNGISVGAKVSQLTNNQKLMSNADILSNTSGNSLYCENGDNLFAEISPNNSEMIAMAQKAISQWSLNMNYTEQLTKTYSDKVTISGDISFENQNGNALPTKVELEKTFSGNTTKAILTIPEGAKVKSTTNGITKDFTGVFMAPKLADDNIIKGLEEAVKNTEKKNVINVLNFGAEDEELTLIDDSERSGEFTITLHFTGMEGKTINVLYSQNGENWTEYGNLTVDEFGDVTFPVPHLTYYGFTTEETSEEEGDSSTPAAGNIGGGESLSIDVCGENRDCSDSYYDNLCGACTTGEQLTEEQEKKEITCNKYSTELNEAYSFAYLNSITTVDDCEKANLNGELIRSHMAKMISNFAINKLGLKPNTGTVCEFTDINNETAEMKFYANLACQLGLMGLNTDGTTNTVFNPNEVVTRAQFGTILSRTLRGDKNNGGNIYYKKHLDELKENGIMTKINTPLAKELRGWVMLMLQRTAQK